MTTNNINKISRYPGIEPFSIEQKEVFFGRDLDIENLFNILINNKHVVLFAKSGLGKSSLINAGLVPKILETGAMDIYTIRIGNYQPNISLSPVETVKHFIENENGDTTILDKIISNENQLWYKLKSMQLAGKKQVQLLIFDQFEELFSYPPEDIFQFKKQISDLLFSIMPQNFRKVLQVKTSKNPDFLTGKELDLLNDQIPVKILFAIRDDKMSFLKELTDFLPDIMRIMFEIKPLNKQQTEEAILSPAKRIDEKYISPNFSFSQNAVLQIYNFLTKENTQPVETTQLQLLCNRCEQLVCDKSIQQNADYKAGASLQLVPNAEQKAGANLQHVPIEITPEMIPDFDNIFIDFYNDVIKNLPENERLKTCKFIEDEMIKKERRIAVDRLVCLDVISENSLLILVNKHLIRAERSTAGGTSYELAHDTLVPPILEIRKIRIEKEEEERTKAENEEKLRIAHEKAEKERIEREKERKRQRTIIAIVSVAAIISISLAIWGFIQKNIAEKALITAEEKTKIAEQKEKETLEATINYYLGDASSSMKEKDYQAAMEKYLYLRNTIMKGETNDSIEVKIKKCQNLILYEQKYDSLMTLADISLENKDYEKVVELYTQALETDIDNDKIYSNLKDILIDVENLITEHKENADAAAKIDMNESRTQRAIENKMRAVKTSINNLLSKTL